MSSPCKKRTCGAKMFLQQRRQLGFQRAVRCFLGSCLGFVFFFSPVKYWIRFNLPGGGGAEGDCDKHYVPADLLLVLFIIIM